MSEYGVNPPGWGYEPETRDANFIPRNGNVSAGRCYPLALGSANQITADGVTLSTTPGDAGFPYANMVVGIGSADRRSGKFVIAMAAGNDGVPTKARQKGLVRAYVVDTSNAAITIGKELVAGAAGTSQLSSLSTDYTGGTTVRKCIGIAMEANAGTTSDGVTILVDFNGDEGHGFGNAT